MSPGTIAARILIGVIVGILVGLTGIGGGVVLLPVLISILGVPPIIAVGSDAVVNCVTKMGAGLIHWRRGNVRWQLVSALTLGSIPGAGLGLMFLTLLRASRGNGVNDFLKILIAVLLIIIPIGYLYVKPSSAIRNTFVATESIKDYCGIALIGFFVGVLVGITSIGSGTVTLMLLLVLYGYSPAVVVGSDVVHALLLTGFTSLIQARLGNVDFALVGYILIGSIPGGMLGAYITKSISATRLKQTLCAILVAFGVQMFWEGILHAK